MWVFSTFLYSLSKQVTNTLDQSLELDDDSFAIETFMFRLATHHASFDYARTFLVWDLVISHLITTARHSSTPEPSLWTDGWHYNFDDSYASEVNLEMTMSVDEEFRQKRSFGQWVNVRRRSAEKMKLETYLWMFEMIKSVCVGQEEEINDRSSAESGRVLDVHQVQKMTGTRSALPSLQSICTAPKWRKICWSSH